jgi:hypothetical protein
MGREFAKNALYTNIRRILINHVNKYYNSIIYYYYISYFKELISI